MTAAPLTPAAGAAPPVRGSLCGRRCEATIDRLTTQHDRLATELDATYADLDAVYAVLDGFLLVQRRHGLGRGQRGAALTVLAQRARTLLYPPRPDVDGVDGGDGTGSDTGGRP